jgi:uncharacterized protein
MTTREVESGALTRPYQEGLARGELLFQRCRKCRCAYLPAREACPNCLSADVAWERASGKGKVVSWVVYHTAYAEHLKSWVPYDVTLVELDEGPRLLTNIVDSGAGKALSTGLRVRLNIVTVDGAPLARFRIDQE